MASQAQIAANRRNSRKSTGPATDAGKAASSLNALKSGAYAESLLIDGESADTLDDLARQYNATCRPVGPREQATVDALIHADWLLRRTRRVETLLWNDAIQDERDTKGSAFEPEWAHLTAWDSSTHHLDRLQRRISALERSYHRALADLQRLQTNRPPAPAPVALPEPVETAPASPQIGFVPSPVVPPPASDPLPTPSTTPTARFSPTLGHFPQSEPLQNPTGAANSHTGAPPVAFSDFQALWS